MRKKETKQISDEQSITTISKQQHDFLEEMLGSDGLYSSTIKESDLINRGTKVLYLNWATSLACQAFNVKLDRLYQSGLVGMQDESNLGLIRSFKFINNIYFNNEVKFGEHGIRDAVDHWFGRLGGKVDLADMRMALNSMVRNITNELKDGFTTELSEEIKARELEDEQITRQAGWRRTLDLPLAQLVGPPTELNDVLTLEQYDQLPVEHREVIEFKPTQIKFLIQRQGLTFKQLVSLNIKNLELLVGYPFGIEVLLQKNILMSKILELDEQQLFNLLAYSHVTRLLLESNLSFNALITLPTPVLFLLTLHLDNFKILINLNVPISDILQFEEQKLSILLKRPISFSYISRHFGVADMENIAPYQFTNHLDSMGKHINTLIDYNVTLAQINQLNTHQFKALFFADMNSLQTLFSRGVSFSQLSSLSLFKQLLDLSPKEAEEVYVCLFDTLNLLFELDATYQMVNKLDVHTICILSDYSLELKDLKQKGVKFSVLMQFDKTKLKLILHYYNDIFFLMENGIDFDFEAILKLSVNQFYALVVNSISTVKLIQRNVSFSDIVNFPDIYNNENMGPYCIDSQLLLLNITCGLNQLMDTGLSFKEIQELDSEKVIILLYYYFRISQLKKSGFYIPNFIKLPVEKVSLILADASTIIELINHKVTINSLVHTEVKILSKVLDSFDNIQYLLSHGVPFDLIISLCADKFQAFVCCHPSLICSLRKKGVSFLELSTLKIFDNIARLRDDKNLTEEQSQVILCNLARSIEQLMRQGMSFKDIKKLDKTKTIFLTLNIDSVNYLLNHDILLSDLIGLSIVKLKKLINYAPSVIELVSRGMLSFRTIISFEENKLNILLEKTDNAFKLYYNGISFNTLIALSNTKLKCLLKDTCAVLNLMIKHDVTFEELIKLDANKLEILLKNHRKVGSLIKAGTSFEQISALNSSELSNVLAKPNLNDSIEILKSLNGESRSAFKP